MSMKNNTLKKEKKAIPSLKLWWQNQNRIYDKWER